MNRQLFNGSSDEEIQITLSTSGEVFASPLLLGFLETFPIEQYPNARFRIQTNGLLLKKRWNRISHLRDKIDLTPRQ